MRTSLESRVLKNIFSESEIPTVRSSREHLKFAAALNLQKPGRSVLFNKALFSLNDQRGFVLKPEAIISGNIPKFPVEKLTLRVSSKSDTGVN